ncbi:MAG TPA: PfkB family carbohydrate kinase [Phycisphaerae bacterium]|nr:PfkB family carbohydrate kinase [Phycisphaerae bacterium]
MPEEQADLCVFAPTLFLTVTVESVADTDETDIHFHPGGQGFWIARVLRRLGLRPVIVAPFGGETGDVLRGLLGTWDVDFTAVDIQQSSPVYMHDRRGGQRVSIAESPIPVLNRHELDDLYGRMLSTAAGAEICVVTGRAPGDTLSVELYRRLGADLAALNVAVIGDLHGAELEAFLDKGALHTLKVSDGDLVEDGALVEDAGTSQRVKALRRLRQLGAQRVVLSSDAHPTLACFGDEFYQAQVPTLESVDHRGSGDSMTAGLAMAAIHRLDPIRALQISCAAGAANVTRHGLGNMEVGLVEQLADRVEVEPLDGGDH